MDQDANNAPDFNSSPNGGAVADGSTSRSTRPQHAQSYRDAAVANLFYSNNMIHDVLHRYGFDEASGNFQANNYDRGGTGGDYVRAEAAGRQRHQQRQLLDAGRRRRLAADADVPVAGQPVRRAERSHVDGGPTFGASWARFTPPATAAGPARPHARLRRHRLHASRRIRPRSRRELDRGRRRRHRHGRARTCSASSRRSRSTPSVVVAHNAAGGNAAAAHRLDDRRPGGDPGRGGQRRPTARRSRR